YGRASSRLRGDAAGGEKHRASSCVIRARERGFTSPEFRARLDPFRSLFCFRLFMSFGHPSRVADAAAFCIVALFGAACTRAIEGAIRYADKTLLRRLIDLSRGLATPAPSRQRSAEMMRSVWLTRLAGLALAAL